MDVDKLLKALDNEENKKFMNLTTTKINKMKMEILKELHLSSGILADYSKKLKEYVYIDEMSELCYGSFIRWIPIKDLDNIYLTPGGIICDIKVADNGVNIVCKNFAHKHYQIKLDECLIFQKLSSQEQVLLSALDFLDK